MSVDITVIAVGLKTNAAGAARNLEKTMSVFDDLPASHIDELLKVLGGDLPNLEQAIDLTNCSYNGGSKRVFKALPLLLELAVETAKEYEDAADWKDVRGKLSALARQALEKLK